MSAVAADSPRDPLLKRTPEGRLAEARALARFAWPGERWENRESWTPRLITEPDLRRQTYERALEQLEFQRRMVIAAYRALEGSDA